MSAQDWFGLKSSLSLGSTQMCGIYVFVAVSPRATSHGVGQDRQVWSLAIPGEGAHMIAAGLCVLSAATQKLWPCHELCAALPEILAT